MTNWKLPWTGGCRCGAIRVTVAAPPLLTSVCHCRGCQRMTGSAFSTTVTVPDDGFSASGDAVLGGLQQPPASHYHCPFCKSWVFTRVDGMPFVNLRATMLDDPSWFEPFIEVNTVEKLHWVQTPARFSFETQPPIEEYQSYIDRFANSDIGPH